MLRVSTSTVASVAVLVHYSGCNHQAMFKRAATVGDTILAKTTWTPCPCPCMLRYTAIQHYTTTNSVLQYTTHGEATTRLYTGLRKKIKGPSNSVSFRHENGPSNSYVVEGDEKKASRSFDPLRREHNERFIFFTSALPLSNSITSTLSLPSVRKKKGRQPEPQHESHEFP